MNAKSKPPSKPNDSSEPPQSHLIIPPIDISEILGFLDLLRTKDHGKEDIYKLANELKMEFGDTLGVVRAAELLNLVHTPGGDVVLLPLGEKVTKSRISQKKEIITEQISKLPIMEKLTAFLNAQEDHEASRDEVLDKLAEVLPNEDAEETFSNLLQWGRYAELFGYNDDDHIFYLDEEEDTDPPMSSQSSSSESRDSN